jgi:hypothetical protein
MTLADVNLGADGSLLAVLLIVAVALLIICLARTIGELGE